MLTQLHNYIFSVKPIISLVIIIAAVLIWRAFKKLCLKTLNHFDDRPTLKRNGKTFLNILRMLGLFILVIVVLQANGVNVTTLAAGLGVTGIIIGYGLQQLINDWVMGISIIWDNYFALGDFIRIGNISGKVVAFTLKSTRIEDFDTGNIVTINNRDMSNVHIVSNRVDILVPFPYGLSSEEMKAVAELLAERFKAINGVVSAAYLGIQNLGESQISALIRINCRDILLSGQIRRDANGLIVTTFEEKKMDIPFNQLDVHLFGDGGKKEIKNVDL